MILHARSTLARAAAAMLLAALLSGCNATIKPETGPLTIDQRQAEAQRLAIQANELAAADKCNEAIELYKQSVTLYSKDAFTWYNLGVCCSRQKRLAEAAEAWNQAAALDAKDPRAYFALGLQLQDQGWLDDAADYYNRSLDRDPNYLPALQKAVQVDQLREAYSDVTLDRIRRALLQENALGPVWVDYLRRMQLKTQERISRPAGIAGH